MSLYSRRILAFALAAFPALAACDGEPSGPRVLGCTDIAALNFDREATVDNGSCTFDATMNYTMTSLDQDVIPADRRVTVLFQVNDESGQGVGGLTDADFRIAENGRLVGVEALPSFSPQTIPFTIRTVLLLDLSSSVQGLVPQIKQAAITLVNRKLPNQEFAIYRFDAQATLVQEFTSNSTTLINAIQSLPETGLVNSTNLYGAIRTAAGSWEDVYATDRILDGSIVLFTDGYHNANSLTVNDALTALRKSDGTSKKLFIAALNSPDLSRAPLQQLTAGTPERFVEASNISELANAFTEIQTGIANRSSSLYLLNYQSPITDPASRQEKLEIAILGNSNRGRDGRISTEFNSRGFGE